MSRTVDFAILVSLVSVVVIHLAWNADHYLERVLPEDTGMPGEMFEHLAECVTEPRRCI